MPLDADQRRRFARHLLLAELGEDGQERLCAARVHVPAGADGRAAAVAVDYLTRAGVPVATDGDGDAVSALPSPSRVASLAGSELLEDAAADLAGALAAVEAIKAAAGVGQAASLPDDYVLAPTPSQLSKDAS